MLFGSSDDDDELKEQTERLRSNAEKYPEMVEVEKLLEPFEADHEEAQEIAAEGLSMVAEAEPRRLANVSTELIEATKPGTATVATRGTMATVIETVASKSPHVLDDDLGALAESLELETKPDTEISEQKIKYLCQALCQVDVDKAEEIVEAFCDHDDPSVRHAARSAHQSL
jgi:hypothetical protein